MVLRIRGHIDVAGVSVYFPARNSVFGYVLLTRSRFGLRTQETPKTWIVAALCDDRGGRPTKREKGTAMAIGTVKFFNTQKGFGFIQPDDGSNDVFVHISALERAGMRSLMEGQKVSYEVVTEKGRPAAGNLATV